MTPAPTATCDQPIGLFDSGVGGLSVASALLDALPNEPLWYVADSAHCPYGPRSPEEILRLSTGICEFLVSQGAKAVVVACNTASAAALEPLRRTFPGTPIVGMVPAVKPAAQLTRSGVVGVLATPATFGGHLYQDVVEHYAEGVRVLSSVCSGLVECVEAGDLAGPRTVALLEQSLRPLRDAGADTLVLGCTHYPFLIPTLQAMVGDEMRLVETGEAIARQTARVLERGGLRRREPAAPRHVFGTTGEPRALGRALRQLLERDEATVALQWTASRLTFASAT